ncbi:MAG: NotI family restriction endonuclease [Deltaproteobacteria bacterium]
MKKYKHPLAEVFGFKITDQTVAAKKHRDNELCPFNNIGPRCTKDKKDAPLGVCSLYTDDSITIICPIRFREDWVICEHAADFFFPKGTKYTVLKEIRLKERTGESAGNIDVVLVVHDKKGKISDFGIIEVQAVYVSGNIRNPFEYYMDDPKKRGNMDWTKKAHYPHPDYLSSSRKRLVPQLMYKGQILRTWGKKQAVAVDRLFFETLPELPHAPKEEAEICWLIYELKDKAGRYALSLSEKVYTKFEPSLAKIATPVVGDEKDFIQILEGKLRSHLRFGCNAFQKSGAIRTRI